MNTRFQVEMAKALRELVPIAPLSDVIVIKEIAHRRHLRHLPAPIGAWLAITTHIRHNHTVYDALLDEGYDSDSARHFVLDEMNDVLRSWDATRYLEADEDELEILKDYRQPAGSPTEDDPE